MAKRLNEAYDLEKFPDFVNDKLDGVKVELTNLDSGERNFTLKLTGNSTNFDKAKETVKELMADLHGEYSVVGGEKDSLKYSADKKGNFKLSAGKNISSVVNKILEGGDIRKSLIGVKEDEQDGKIKMTASIAVDGRIDVEFYVDKDATVDDIKEAAENAFMEADLSDMEVVNSSPVNAESVDGITVPFFDFD
jgi:hypothetical protein